MDAVTYIGDINFSLCVVYWYDSQIQFVKRRCVVNGWLRPLPGEDYRNRFAPAQPGKKKKSAQNPREP